MNFTGIMGTVASLYGRIIYGDRSNLNPIMFYASARSRTFVAGTRTLTFVASARPRTFIASDRRP